MATLPVDCDSETIVHTNSIGIYLFLPFMFNAGSNATYKYLEKLQNQLSHEIRVQKREIRSVEYLNVSTEIFTN